ncbi:MAG: HGGxSTG domain-containing protein [Betaproteobacteria bacterium]
MSTSLNREIRVQTLSTGGGRITCQRCLGVSRRTGVQCAAPAERGRNWCRFHGGKSLGPTSPEGRARCAAAKTVHGQETRAARAERSRDMATIRALEALGYVAGSLTGPRMRGRKPRHG